MIEPNPEIERLVTDNERMKEIMSGSLSQQAKPLPYELTMLKQAVDDLDKRLSARIDSSEKSQRRSFLIMLLTLIVAFATLIVAIVK